MMQLNEDKENLPVTGRRIAEIISRNLATYVMFFSLAAPVIRHWNTSTRSHLCKNSLFKHFASAMWCLNDFMCTVKW